MRDNLCKLPQSWTPACVEGELGTAVALMSTKLRQNVKARGCWHESDGPGPIKHPHGRPIRPGRTTRRPPKVIQTGQSGQRGAPKKSFKLASLDDEAPPTSHSNWPVWAGKGVKTKCSRCSAGSQTIY